MPRCELSPTPDERAALERTRSRNPRPHQRECAGALLKVADGQSARRVALEGRCRPRKLETVRRWVARYRAGGLTGLEHRPLGRRGLSPLRAAEMARTVRQEPARPGPGTAPPAAGGAWPTGRRPSPA